MPVLSCLNRVKRTKSTDGCSNRPKAAADIQIFRYRIDRSGSMCSLKQQAIEGTFDYLKTSAETAYKNGSNGHITFGTFDDEIETVLDKASFSEVLNILKDDGKFWIADKILPRNLTKLRDAVIEDVCSLRREKKEIEKNMSKEVKRLNPTVIVTYAVFTDGDDNSSRHSVKMMSDAVKAARNDDIICLFLAANQDACSAGERFGFSAAHSLNVDSHGDGAEMGFRSATVATQRAVTQSAFAPPGSALRQTSAAFTQLERNVSSQSTGPTQPLRFRSAPPPNAPSINHAINTPLPTNPRRNLRQPTTQNYRSQRQSPLSVNAVNWNPQNPYRTRASRYALNHQGPIVHHY